MTPYELGKHHAETDLTDFSLCPYEPETLESDEWCRGHRDHSRYIESILTDEQYIDRIYKRDKQLMLF